MERLLTVKDLTELLGVSKWTVYRLCKNDLIPHRKETFGYRFLPESIQEYIERGERAAVALQKKIIKYLTKSPSVVIDKAKGGDMAALKKGRRNFVYGSIYQRKPGGHWTIDYRSPQGKRRQRVVKEARSWQEAHEALRHRILEEYTKEAKREKKKISFSEFADIFHHDYMSVARRNFRSDEYRLKRLKEFFKDTELRVITPLMIERFRSQRLNKGNSKSTVNRYVALLKRMFNIAIDEEYLEQNPAAKIKLYSEKDTIKERILTEEEEKKLLEASSPTLHSVLLIMLQSGLRPGEVFSLRWEQINFNLRVITVERTKSGKIRHIPMNKALFEELKSLKSSVNSKSPYVFLNEKTGKPITTVNKAFRAACKRAGLKGLRLYDARHTFASRLVRCGADIETVRSLLGHSDIKITQRYTHSNEAVKREAVELLSSKKGLACDKLVTNAPAAIADTLPIPLFTVN